MDYRPVRDVRLDAARDEETRYSRRSRGVRGYVDCVECGKRTHGGKQFCADHIYMMPYVKTLGNTDGRR